DQTGRRRVGKLDLEGGVELQGEAASQVHGAERMLEAAVLGGGKHPARGLELGHAAQTLHPRGVDQILLGALVRGAVGTRVEHVVMDGIGDEPAALVGLYALHASSVLYLSEVR